MLKICDSIAVKIFNDTQLLVAVGNELRFYKSKCEIEILPWQLTGKIHGIEINKHSNIILIYGEKQFMLLSYKNNKFTKITTHFISDWISNVRFLELNKFCLLTGHLVLLELEYNDLLDNCKIVQQCSCEDKSTLYCSFIIGDKWNDLLIFGGTAMEVVVWQPISKTVLCRISGNNGVILSINVNLKFDLLTTTSDDRSIKFYNIKLDKDTKSPNKIVCTFKDSYIQGYAHTARVFQGKIIEENNQPYAISVGEDSNLCLWNCQGELLFKRLHHFGATIWNFDYDSITATVYTIGSDGNCIAYNLKSKFTKKNPKILKSLTLNESEYLEKIKFLDKYHIIAITNKYNLIFRSVESDWIYIKDLSTVKCTVLQVFNEFVCLAGYKNIILLKFDYKNEKFELIFDKELLNGVIRSVCFLSEQELLACDENGNCKYLLNNFKTIMQLETPKCKDRWITSAIKIDNFFMFSNRQGNLYLYLFENENFVFKSMIKRVNGKLGVTKINLEENTTDYAIVKTIGHDSTIKMIKLDKIVHVINVFSRQNVPIAWSEKLEKCEQYEYIMGFNSIDFVLWSKRDDIIAEINCGGGHRFWDCKLNKTENSIQLIYIKKGQLYMFENELRNIKINQLKIPRNSWHVKPCNSIKLIKCASNTILFSGGEDNILKISKFTNNEKLTLEQEMFLHISSIKTISFVKNFDNFIIFSAGGRAQICVTTFNPITYKIAENCNYMLKFSDFNRKYLRNTQEIDFDPETRIMSMAINEIDKEIFEIFTGCSDGYIRKFIYNIKLNTIELSDELFYNKCILHIRIIRNSFLISAATDGYINFWNLNEFSTNSIVLFQIQHHKNGVNSLDIKSNEDRIFVVSGGDDQNVVFSIIKINLNNFEIINTKLFNNLHSAQVNGVKMTEDFKYFYTASIDQTICKVDIDNYKLITKIRTCVPDIKGIRLLSSMIKNDNIVIVFGCGIESFNI